MAKKKEGPLPDPAEQVIEQFLSELSTAADRDRSRNKLKPLYDALFDLEAAARKLNQQVERTAREVVRIADSLDGSTDHVSEWLKFATLGPMVDALRDRLAGDEPARRRRKRTKWTLDSTLLGGLVAFGNKPSYPLRARARIGSTHRGCRGARPARREEGEYIYVFNQRATPRAGTDRRPNAEVILARALTWPTRTGRRPSFLRLFGSSQAAGPDWLTVFLLYRIVDVWRIATGLWAPSKLAEHDIGGDPEKCFHMQLPAESSISQGACLPAQLPIIPTYRNWPNHLPVT